MKRRWSILFWLALTTLIGTSWLATSFGIDLMSLMSAGMAGAVVAAVVAFVAMLRSIREKWPAAIVLVCAGPLGLTTLRVLFDLPSLVSWFGPSIVLIVLGNVGTIVCAIVLLAAKLPPAPSPVAPARVVD